MNKFYIFIITIYIYKIILKVILIFETASVSIFLCQNLNFQDNLYYNKWWTGEFFRARLPIGKLEIYIVIFKK